MRKILLFIDLFPPIYNKLFGSNKLFSIAIFWICDIVYLPWRMSAARAKAL